MTISSLSGPIDVTGQTPAAQPASGPIGGTPQDYNQDLGPSLVWAGWAVRDPRYLPKIGENNAAVVSGTPQDIGYLFSAGCVAVDQIPAPSAVGNVAASQHATTTGVTFSLVTTTTSAVTLTTAATTIYQTGNVVPSGVLVLDTVPQTALFGQTGAIQIADPTHALTRIVAITAASGGTGGNVTVSGYDLYGFPQTEQIAVASGSGAAVTTRGKKDWKFITSVIPAFADTTHNYDVHTDDTFGFPLRVDSIGYADMWWNSQANTSATGFTAASASAATSTTGAVRGTWSTPSSSDGTKRLQVFVSPSVVNLASNSASGVAQGLFGVTPA